ncbi:hypothetical protein SAMN05421803_106226 [Nocardiopsis flavescens]|uniref:Uncharacterized protein n=1 Tax=Nocardiopsis flavescens TaxID=758803 RepID=A0A1M6JQG1_9ACTN|nr:hypothetical protein [Nocardiopsis flavescens]SHJ48959.1 hypothetical protein SAMN05421803_106226 [Nocardiopsis flavescens]
MSAPTFRWLPERHLGVAATLSHADELIGQISDHLFEYMAREGGPVGLREVLVGPTSQAVVDRVAPIPRKIPLLVADALVSLRAAVEHTMFTEAEFLNGGPLDEKAARSIEMPANLTYEEFEKWTNNRSRRGPDSLRVGGELLRRVKGLQPFQRQVAPRLHPLARLVLHTNHAKHRTPAVTAVRLPAVIREDEKVHSVRDLPPRAEEPLRVGEVIAEVPVGKRVPITLFPTVGINRPGTDEWPVLMHELDEIAYWIRTQAVPRLITGSEPPESPLPPRYEISIGHLDERLAISMGSTTSAAERNKQRLGAASARNDLVDLIYGMPDAPDREKISAWLEKLTDEEIIDRISRLSANHSYDPNIIRSNLEALQELRNEAVAFTNE